MKKLFAVILAAAMVLSLAACGSSEAPAATTAAAATEAATTAAKAEAATTAAAATEAAKAEEKEPVTLTVWYYEDNEATDATWDKIAEGVHEQYPWITVEYERLPYDSGPEKFTIACATGTTPDIYMDGYSRIAPAVHAGITLDITDVVDANRDYLLYDSQIDGMVGDEIHYLVLSDGNPYCNLVNMDLVEEMGLTDMLPADKLTWSYDEYLAFCRAIKEKRPDLYPQDLFAGSRSSDAWYYSWILGAGSKICSEDLTATDFNSDANREASLKVLNLFKTLIDEELVPSGISTLVDQDVEQFWYSGNVVMRHGGWNNISTVYNSIQEGTVPEINYAAYALPTPDGKEPGDVASWGSSGLCAFPNNGHEEAIKCYIEYMLQATEINSERFSISGAMPLLSNVTVEYPETWIAEEAEVAKVYGAKHNHSDFGILEPWWTDFRETLYPQLQDFFTGKIDAQTVLDNWQAAGDKVISDYHSAN